ncbi:MAG: 1-acyl-sn-glycerol-3-phosphate acyltransferase [Woeseiaceae bacterium]|nr:1-acyl-sn-glycerol-3-phosphate acyltransferase [Woeseiaceae bacterium]
MSGSAENVVNPWPDAERVVFLVDRDTRVERRLIERLIRESAPEGVDSTIIRVRLRRESPSEREVREVVAATGGVPDTQIVPLRITWFPTGPHAARKTLVRDLLVGNTYNPGRIRQWWIRRRQPAPFKLVVAESADIANLEARFSASGPASDDRASFAAFVLKAAFLALERAERHVKGSRYKIPKLFPTEVIGPGTRVQSVLEELSRLTGKPIDALREEAADCLEEMRANHTGIAVDRMASLGRYLYTRAFDPEIDLLPEDLERVKRLVSEQPVAFVFTHKSHIDGFMLVTLFYDYNLPPVHVFAGINMKMRGLGAFFRAAGSIFLRRSFQDDPVYKAVFKSYIDYLGQNRFPLMWALEGTRSRIGKLMPPRYGLLNYVVSAYSHGDASDVLFLPIAAIYDQVPEVGDFDAIQGGAKKRPETTSWFMEYISGLKAPHGRIRVRFGRGVRLSELADLGDEDDNSRERVVQKLAFRLAVDVNNVTPVTPTAIITFVMLAHGHRALTRSELIDELWPMLKLIHKMQLPRTADLTSPEAEVLERGLELLESRKVITVFRDGEEPVYAVAADAGRSAAYYRNGMIHFFVNGAIADLAMLFVRDDSDVPVVEQLHAAALSIRDLLKFEFFFEETENFIQSIDEHLDLRAPGWRGDLTGRDADVRALLRRAEPILGHRVLRPFFEAYLIVAEVLEQSGIDASNEESTIVQGALRLGKQRLHQQRMHCEESLSINYFDNAVKLAENRGLLGHNKVTEAGRSAYRDELADLVNKVRRLATLAESRSLEQRRG